MTILMVPSANQLLKKKEKTGVLLQKCLAETAMKTNIRGLFEGDKQTVIEQASLKKYVA